MSATRRLLLSALALTAGSTAAVCLPSAVGAAPNPAPLPQYLVAFSASALPATTLELQFHSTRCAIGPATDPVVVTCDETGSISFTAAGGSGVATVSSALAGINWKFTLVRSGPTGSTYRMSGRGTESVGTSPVVRAVKVTGTLTVGHAAVPTISGTEEVYPVPTTVP